MRWKVYSDSYLLFDPLLEGYDILSPVLNLELNKAGSFQFTIYSDHPNFDRLDKMKSIITVYQDSEIVFRGRILNDSVGFYNERQVYCEGELAFLLDSVQRPFQFPAQEGDIATPAAYLGFLLSRHNDQVSADRQFTLGTVTVTDPNDYISRSDTEYENTFDLIQNGLISSLGGYLWVRHLNGVNYLDYISDFDTVSTQFVEFGKNLLDLGKERKGEDIATAIVPLGKANEETGERVTIADVPDETTSDICKSGDMVYSVAAEATYDGRITKTVVWEDVTEPVNLCNKAKARLQQLMLQKQTIELSAADLSAAGYNVDSFHLGTKIVAKSDPHNLDANYLVQKITIYLLTPGSNVITVGETIYSFTEENKKQQETQWQKVQTNIEINQSIALLELENRTNSAILQNSESILSKVSDEYYSKADGQLVESRTTSVEQKADQIEVNFTTLRTNFDDLSAYADGEFASIKKYIRFVDGNIVLGEEGNQLVLKIQNDRISFLENNAEVAYLSDKKLYVTDGEFLNALNLGVFGFLPRSNNNLTFKKVT